MAADPGLSPPTQPEPRQETRRSALWALGGAQASAVVTLASSFVLARLLQPHDTGTYAMAGVLVALANLFRDFGVGTYVVQERELTTATLRAALGVALVTAWTMALLLWLGAGPFAAAMGEPGVAPVLSILALNFLIIPFGSVAYSMLRRQMAFRKRAGIEITSAVAQTIVAITLAGRGMGAEALAWGSLANVLCTVIGTAAVRPADMPWRPSLKGARAVMRFGAPASLANLLKYANESLPTVLIGRGLGASDLGLFRRAEGLAGLLQGVARAPASNVMLPVLSAAQRDHHDASRARGRFATSYKQATTLVAGMALPFALTAIALTEPLILLLYGSTWLPASPLVPPLAIAAVLAVPQWFVVDMLLAANLPRVVARLEALSLAVLAAMLVVALPMGLQAVAWLACAAVSVATVLKCRYIARRFGISLREQVGCWWPATKVCAGLLPIAVAAAFLLGSAPGPWSTLAGLGTLVICYALLLRFQRHPLWNELVRCVPGDRVSRARSQDTEA